MAARLIGSRPLPEFYSIRQLFDGRRIPEAGIAEAVARALARPNTLDRVRPGDAIAIAVGSRGISNIALIAKTLAGFVRSAGAKPFIVPAMGSHGGATAEGQRQVLEDYGVTEALVGCPIVSSMDAVPIGETPHGVRVFFDASARKADGVILLNRVKPHTDFRGRIESGLAKQIVIGLGKQRGAEACHSHGLRHMSRNIQEAAALALERTGLLFGLGLVENAYDQTRTIKAIPAESLLDEEPALLDEARAHMPSILLSPFDVLIVDEIGKNISGSGMDPNITGRFPTADVSGGADAQRCVVLDITEQSHGNGIGLGFADYTVARAFDKFDFEMTYPNVLTNTLPTSGKLPLIFANDLMAVRAAIKTCNEIDAERPQIVRIKNTLRMDRMYISEAMIERARAHAAIEVVGGPESFAFDGAGNISFDVW
ncbi:MAG: nickel-dependent lactate racemase [Clostridiales bacterium]|nr:nickel-dependent lactate racemase [Clostridiales bacterium]